jgi:hypothetical protein
MTITVTQKLSSAFTDTSLPKLYRDPILTAGSLFLFDALNSYSNPNADGNIANGATFANLIDGAPGATANLLGSHFQNLTGKAGIYSDGAGGGSAIGMGASTYDLSASNHEFWAWLWFKLPSTGYTTSNYQSPFFYSTSNANTSQWWFDLGVGGVQPRFSIGEGGTSAMTLTSPTNITPGSIYMLAGHWKAGALMEMYLNGSLNNSNSSGIPSSLQAGSTAQPSITDNVTGTIYRWGLEDLTVSGASAAAQASAEYNANHTRFI